MGKMKRVAISQSNYIPWKGYFDLVASADEFIIFDDAQYTRRDWRNRNQIKTPRGIQWITVPVLAKGSYHRKIREIKIDGSGWAAGHWKSLTLNYGRSPHFSEIASWLEPVYLAQNYQTLSQVNRNFIEAICNYLSIETIIRNSTDYTLSGGKSERLADLCLQSGATAYISGPAAKAYLEEEAFSNRGIKVEWFNYSGYPVYPQLWGDFAHHVTILDLLFNCGKASPRFMKFSE